MTRLIFVRHGQSMANVEDLFAGQSDYPLSPLGHMQAEKTAEFLAGQKIDAIYSSDLPRAYMTAAHIAPKHRLSIRQDLRLREILAGDWEGRSFSWIQTHYPEECGLWLHSPGIGGCPGGETVLAVWRRVVPAIEEIAAAHDGQTVCITSHATSLRTLECAWRKLSPEQMGDIPWLKNASVSMADYDPAAHQAAMLLRDYTEQLTGCVTRLPDGI